MEDDGHAVADAALNAAAVIGEGEGVANAGFTALVGLILLRKAEGVGGVAHGKCHGGRNRERGVG